MIPDDLALQLALGNLDVHTREALDDFDPSTFKVCTELCHNVVKIILLVLGQVKNPGASLNSLRLSFRLAERLIMKNYGPFVCVFYLQNRNLMTHNVSKLYYKVDILCH